MPPAPMRRMGEVVMRCEREGPRVRWIPVRRGWVEVEEAGGSVEAVMVGRCCGKMRDERKPA